jgi:hypothetical protein
MSLQRQVDLGELSAEKANAMGDRYGNRLLTQRAQTIARNESMVAINAGRSELWQQLHEDGHMPGSVSQEWDSALDMARCDLCKQMHGQRRKVGEPFEGPDGEKLMAPPLHVQCRCVVNLVTE